MLRQESWNANLPIEHHFNHPLYHVHILIVYGMFMALVLHIIGRCSQHTSKFVLKMMKITLGAAVSIARLGQPSPLEEKILKDFPTDIRTVRKVFDLEPKTTTFAACTKCCCLYKPEDRNGVPVYPSLCSYKATPSARPCGVRLTESGVWKGQSIRVPIRPYVMQDFHTFVASLLSRPEIEDAIEATNFFTANGESTDISTSKSIRSLRDTDGRPFIAAGDVGETRLVWSLSIDWFNPYLNKIAGKKSSSGSIVLCCLSLPPSLRYKPENMCLIGVIPGPQEPSKEEINHFLRPLVDVLLESYRDGIFVTRTVRFPRGRMTKSALALLVSDLPASRKVSGHASHSAGSFCAYCDLDLAGIGNINWETWRSRSYEDILRAAVAWRDVRTQKERNNLYKTNGVRWSELMRLPYWNHLRAPPDGMHNLFLGLVSHQSRTVLGMDLPDEDDEEVTVDPLKVAKTKELALSPEASYSTLKRCTFPALKAACTDLNISYPRERVTKKVLIGALLVSTRHLLTPNLPESLRTGLCEESNPPHW